MSWESGYKKILLDIINKKIPKCKVYLFGSRARKDYKPGSDIDLAIETDRALCLNEILDIKILIEQTDIPVFVDVVDLRMVSEKLKSEVKEEGILWQN